MCGIVGVFTFDGECVTDDLMSAMVAQVYHRGPDEQRYWLDNFIGLGSARLSILDIEHGQQPISNEDNSVICVFNGEIYNYDNLIEFLKKRGHIFRTASDTEVLVHMYEEYGKSFVEQLNGEFAISIYDRNLNTLFCYRDRVGIRPFYYFYNGKKFVFASEIKSILLDSSIPREIDEKGLDQIFSLWTMVGEKSIFKEIKQLPTGSMLEVSKGKFNIIKYWDYPEGNFEEIWLSKEEDYFFLFEEKLSESVKLRLKADVPVGVYISGGIDSSAISYLATKYNKEKTSSFSVEFDDHQFDEGPYQRELAQYLKTDHFVIRCSYDDIRANIYDVIWHAEQPIFRTAPVPLFMLSKLVREQSLKVVLSGEGADEVLFGYDIFREAKIRGFWAKNKSSSLRPTLLKKLYAYLPQFSNPRYFNLVKDFYIQTLMDTDNPLYSHLPRIINNEANKVYYSDYMKERVKGETALSHIEKSLNYESLQRRSLNYKTQYLEFYTLLSGYLLSSQGDRVSMAHSVEGRFPYLDHNFIEFAARLPEKIKLKFLKDKYILRKALENKIPKKLAQRPKFAYQSPDIKSFLYKGEWGTEVYDYLSPLALKETGVFSPKSVEFLLRKFKNTDPQRTGIRDNMAFVQILSFQILYEQYIKNFSCKNKDKIKNVKKVDFGGKNFGKKN